MESMASLNVPHLASYEHWFLIALERNEHELALEIADRGRRHRFFSSLPIGARLLACAGSSRRPTACSATRRSWSGKAC